MAEKRKYRTRQRTLVADILAKNAGSYLSVDDVVTAITDQGDAVGRTTVYRALEAMAAEGSALKAAIPGSEASYRLAEDGAAGQLVCMRCGGVFPLDCDMAGDFAGHVLAHHGFKVDSARTVLYGTCHSCMGAGDAR